MLSNWVILDKFFVFWFFGIEFLYVREVWVRGDCYVNEVIIIYYIVDRIFKGREGILGFFIFCFF